MANKLSEGRRQ